MARITVTLSAEAMEGLEEVQKELSEKMGGGRVTAGFALGYLIKEHRDSIQETKKN